MVQTPLPQEFMLLTEDETRHRIRAAKASLGSRAVVLGHHYQRDEIIEHADFRGDSYKLAQHARQTPDADFIVFCGVHFMAESADVLTPDTQKVILPNLAAGCSMADMANIFQVKRCWAELQGALGGSPAAPTIVPVTYINSAANLKSFVGEHGGVVCTSTNAPGALEWALDRGQKVLFFPDQHLGRNTAAAMGYDVERDMIVWDPFKPLGGNTPERIREAKFYLWKGHCSVHKRFTVDQIEQARAAYPGLKVIVHPECEREVVQAADFYGSTEYILHQIEGAGPGSAWAVGTEINLVNRIAKENPDRTVFCLDPQICPCSTMYRIHPSFLCWALENLVDGNVVNQVTVPADVKRWALVALERMLEIGKVPVAHVD
ncbi:MAG: quinolinate synthase NadA [Armatimonadetes bacterium]|nr:quinolinate synthase NadA [Armatimonadota bacterium]